MDSDSILEGLREAVRNYDKDRARRFAEKAVEKGIDPVEALEDGLAKARANILNGFVRCETMT
jgi:methanogenic corrinoid protein MtbC1